MKFVNYYEPFMFNTPGGERIRREIEIAAKKNASREPYKKSFLCFPFPGNDAAIGVHVDIAVSRPTLDYARAAGIDPSITSMVVTIEVSGYLPNARRENIRLLRQIAASYPPLRPLFQA